MSLFDDFSRFLETRLEEFLRAHPELELQALEEQLREQEAETRRLILDLQAQRKLLETKILETAQDVKRWHVRIERVRAGGEEKLAQAAEEREAALLRQGNQLWGQMEGVKQQIQAAEGLLRQIQTRRQEVSAKASQVRSPYTAWTTSTGSSPTAADPLEEQFRRWEMDAELADLKRQMGR